MLSGCYEQFLMHTNNAKMYTINSAGLNLPLSHFVET